MVHISIIYNGQTADFGFDESSPLAIGRSSRNSLILTHPKCSKQHARLLKYRHLIWVEDLNSSWGTYLNDTKVCDRRVVEGDRLRFGPIEEVLITRVDFAHKFAADETNINLLNPYNSFGSFCRIDDVDKKLRCYTLRKSICRIGRSRTSDIQLDHISISGRHCTLLRRDTRWLVRDENSRNGVFINRKRVDEAVLRDGDVVGVGRLRFRFCDIHDSAIDQPGHR